MRSEEHTSELQSRVDLVCRLLLEKKNRARHRAWCVKTIKAAIRFGHRSLPVKWRVQIAKAFHHLRICCDLLTEGNLRAHRCPFASSRLGKPRRWVQANTKCIMKCNGNPPSS